MLIEAVAPASGKNILLNLHPEQCMVFSFVTKEDLAEAMQECETEKLRSFWDDFLSPVTTEGSATCLKAFISRRDRPRKSFHYLKTGRIQSVLGTNLKGEELVAYIQFKTVEEQKEILNACFPRTHDMVNQTLRDTYNRFGPDKFLWLDKAATPEEFVNHLATFLLIAKPGKGNLDIIKFLIRFWANGLILLPQSILTCSMPFKWTLIYESHPDVFDTIKKIYTTGNTSGSPDKPLGVITAFFATSTATKLSHLSTALIGKFSEFITAQASNEYLEKDNERSGLDVLLSSIHRATYYLYLAFNAENPDLKVSVEQRRHYGNLGIPRRDTKFDWVIVQNPKLSLWADYLYLHLSSFPHKHISSELAALNHFTQYLLTLEAPPLAPWLTNRQKHIFDGTLINENTFFNYLEKTCPSNNGAYLKNILRHVRRFFLWVREQLISEGKQAESNFIDPVLESDRLGVRVYTNRTHRDALPPFLINEMKEALIEDDFAFAKTTALSTVGTIDYTTGYSTRVFCPGLAICMYTLLDTPIRSHQARWLDSGLLDEKIYNPLSGAYELNLSPYAIKGREQGVIQLKVDSLRSESWPAMWINTNKTRTVSSIGYTIPYISPVLLSLFQHQLEWSKRYLPAPEGTLTYKQYSLDVRELRADRTSTGPEITPLFRDPSTSEQKQPFTYSRLARFYTRLLQITEERVYTKYGHRVKLVTINEDNKKTWAVDLHSLRVSGITNLIEAGVPIEVVQQFVAGHSTIVMTLHYLKYSPEKLRGFIEEAYLRMQDDQDFVGSETFINAINEFTPFLIGQSESGTGPGFEALNAGDGIMVINTDGICPGTSCSTGFVVRSGVEPLYGPVPGGKRCPLCRYWITGPAHLLGQINATNNLAYAIRKKGLELVRLNGLKLDAEDSGNQRMARALRDRIDLLNREIELDVAEWTARYKYVVQSNAQMDDYIKAKEDIIATDANPRVPMMTPSTPFELKVTLEQAHEFALLDQITQTAIFNPGFPNGQAELEKNQVLSKMMVANGMKPFLLSMSDEQAREAGNLLSALILQQVNSQDLDEVLTGRMTLEHYPFLALAVQKLEEASADDQNFLTNSLSALSNLIDPCADSVPSDTNDDDGELFG
ncbi:VPA1269 family protein [Pseudomonas sp. CCC2.2]|uniref:VPA1269 family protein n=1 Tax=Pseudomonas sp. CCC2.2 TaxID=3048605 RepID=UPI002B224721|nr:VPA1269 family protein [Pseudomonas sp. CCC2.2]MEB0148626.1 VPA1269 family protein [Pseudomonas sp. CCC2.2]